MKPILLGIGKLAIVAGLIAWLVYGGSLDFGQLRILIDEPRLLVAHVLVWGVLTVGLGALRWSILLRGLRLGIPYTGALRLQLIGLFFGTALPGIVGGDLIKAAYVMKLHPGQGRARVLVSVLLDRVAGLISIFVLAGVSVMARWDVMIARDSTRELAYVTGAGLVAAALGGLMVLGPYADDADPVLRLLRRDFPGFGLLRSVYEALRYFRTRPGLLAASLGVSLIIQTGMLLFALYIARLLTQQVIDGWTFATVFSLGSIAVQLPLAPGGLGVGHVAFERLFALFGLTGGANVFNVFIIGPLCLNLAAAVFYLKYRQPDPAHSETLTPAV